MILQPTPTPQHCSRSWFFPCYVIHIKFKLIQWRGFHFWECLFFPLPHFTYCSHSLRKLWKRNASKSLNSSSHKASLSLVSQKPAVLGLIMLRLMALLMLSAWYLDEHVEKLKIDTNLPLIFFSRMVWDEVLLFYLSSMIVENSM